MIKLTVNGLATDVDAATVAELVATLGLAGKRIAVERNGEIVPRSSHAAHELKDGDTVEIIHAVGGG